MLPNAATVACVLGSGRRRTDGVGTRGATAPALPWARLVLMPTGRRSFRAVRLRDVCVDVTSLLGYVVVVRRRREELSRSSKEKGKGAKRYRTVRSFAHLLTAKSPSSEVRWR